MNSADRTTSTTVATKHNDTNNSGCSISFVWNVMPTSARHTRLLTCTQRLSQGNKGVGSAVPKSTQEYNSKHNSPSSIKGVLTKINVDPTTEESQESPNNLDVMENMSNDASVDVSVLPENPQIISSAAASCTKESQESPNNFDVMENISNVASMAISILPVVPQMILSTAGSGAKGFLELELQGTPKNLDVMVNISNDIPMDGSPEAPQMISSKEENGTHNLSSPESCEVLNEDENKRINGDCSVPNVAKPTEHEGPKPISRHKDSQVCNKAPRQAASKRNAGSSSMKKQNRSTMQSDISDLKLYHGKRKRMRRSSEMIETDQTGAPTNSIDVDHARTILEELRHVDAVAEPDYSPVKQQCNHFSIREYFAVLQKKDPKLYSLSQNFCKKQHQDEYKNLCPISVTKFRRWNCSSCLDKLNSMDITTSITDSPKQNDTNNSGCSVSFVRNVMPTGSHHTRLLTCTQRLSRGKEGVGSAILKSTQEYNSKHNSPSYSKGVLTMLNVDPTTEESQESPDNLDVMENMSNDASVEVSVLSEIPQIISSAAASCTKESQELPNNFDVMENIPNVASMDIFILPVVPQMISSTAGSGAKGIELELRGTPENIDVMVNISNDTPMDDSPEAPQMISSKVENGTQSLSSLKFCEVLNEDENKRINCFLNGDCSVPNVAKPTEHKGPKPISRHKGGHVRNKGSCQAASKRNAESSSKKKQNRSTKPSDISDLKLYHRKRKRMRRLSELIETDLTGGPTNSIDVDHAKTNSLYESDKGEISLEVEKDTGITVSNQRVEEIQSRTAQNKTKLRIDDVDDQSSLMNWMKRIPKKVRTEKKGSGQRSVDSSAVSISIPGITASEKLHLDFVPSACDESLEEDPATTNARHGNKNMQNNCQGPNMLQTRDLCQDAPGNSKQRSLSKGKSTILLKWKVPPTDNAKHGGIKPGSRIVSKNRLKEVDHGQLAPENSQKRLTKVSLGNCDTHNVSGTRDHKMASSKKKQKLQMLHKQIDEMDDISMDVVVLARDQREKQLMTDTDTLEKSHSRAKITQKDCDQIAAKDGSINASTVPDTNFQESLTSQNKHKILSYTSSSTEAPNVHFLEELDTQMSVQGHAVSGTEAPEEQMQNKLPVHAASITKAFHVYPPELRIPDILMCTEEQQAHSHMDKEVTIACVSPTFPRHQDVAEVPTRSLGTNTTNKLIWNSFEAAMRNPSMSSYGAQFRSRFREGDSASTHVFGASNNYPIYPPTIEHYTRKEVNQVPLRNQAMEADRLYDQIIAGQSGLYPRETMPAAHISRLMDSSTASGFTNRSRMEFEASGSSQYLQNQHEASLATSYGSHQIEKFSLTLEDMSRHQVQQNLHRPLRPIPRVGVLGSLLQQDITKWSEHCEGRTGYRPRVSKGIAPFDTNKKESSKALNPGMLKFPLTLEDLSRHQQNLDRPFRPLSRVGALGSSPQQDITKLSEHTEKHTGYRPGVSEGIATFDTNRKENSEALNPGVFSARWNDPQLGSVSSASTEYSSPRYREAQRGRWKVVHPLDKLVRKDICQTNRNPADFTTISDENEYMINL